VAQVAQSSVKIESPFNCRRPPLGQRKFVSPSVEHTIQAVASTIADRELAWLFTNCFPNTLDTTVNFSVDSRDKPDTFIITGDIEAMWLRDSTNQVWPYLCILNEDPHLRDMFRGLINRQAACVRLDPHANAFLRDWNAFSKWQHDHTEMRRGVYERKYELDSLCSVLRLATHYYFQTNDTSCFDEPWLKSIELILQTIRREQAGSDEWTENSHYLFQRTTPFGGDTLNNQGRGNPIRRTGMSRSPFRPSDDATTFQFLIPSNAMAVVCLRDLSRLLHKTGLSSRLADDAARLAEEIDAAIARHALIHHPIHGPIYAYEVDGYGSASLMDDANIPSLLALPYIGYCDIADSAYQSTRAFVLGPSNPFFCRGESAEGICSPHIGAGWIWPMSIAIRALTSDREPEILSCLKMLKQCHGGTGFMHESFWKNDPARFTRPWFAWANSVFGELILSLHRKNPSLLAEPL